MRAIIACLLLSTLPARSEPVTLVSYHELESRLVSRIDFESFPRTLSPGTPLDGLVALEGAQLGERFTGQTLSEIDGFDRLSHFPMPPLRLEAGQNGQNLAVSFIYMLSNQLDGLGVAGYPERSAGGEGAIAILFDRDQFALGFRVAAELEPDIATPPGQMEIAFYRRDATPIATLTVTLDWGLSSYGFLRTDGTEDIAGITITNLDPEGIAIDDVIFDTDLVLGLLR